MLLWGINMSTELIQELILKSISSIEELKALNAIQNERLDQYNRSLENHMAQTVAVRQIAEAASDQAHSAFQVAQTQIERLDMMRASVGTIETMVKEDHVFLSSNKKALSGLSGVYLWFKYTGYAIVALSPLVYGAYLALVYFTK